MTTIEDLDAEIARLQAEAAAVERIGPTFDERWPAVEAELLEAEAVFRRLGPQLGGFQSMMPEHVHQRHQAFIGAAMVADRKALIDSERQRIKAATEGGISATDKQRRLDQLLAAILKAAAKREPALRKVEGDDFMVRSVLPELAIFKQAEVERLAR